MPLGTNGWRIWISGNARPDDVYVDFFFFWDGSDFFSFKVVCVCLCLCYMQSHIYGNMLSHGQTHRCQRMTLDIFLFCYLLYFLETGSRFSLNLNFTLTDRLASQWVPGVCWSLTAQLNTRVIHICGHIQLFKKQAVGIRTRVFICIEQVVLSCYPSSQPQEWLCF